MIGSVLKTVAVLGILAGGGYVLVQIHVMAECYSVVRCGPVNTKPSW